MMKMGKLMAGDRPLPNTPIGKTTAEPTRRSGREAAEG